MNRFTKLPKTGDAVVGELATGQVRFIPLEELEETWMAKLQDDCIFISAREKGNIDALKELMYNRIKAIHIQRYPYNDFLFQNYEE